MSHDPDGSARAASDVDDAVARFDKGRPHRPRPPLFQVPCANVILDGLPSDTRRRLEADLRLVQLTSGRELRRGQAGGGQVYFPAGCLVSLLGLLADGRSACVGLVGCNGMVGADAVLGGYFEGVAVVQIAGPAWQLETSALHLEMLRHSTLLPLLGRYTLGLMIEMSQMAVCNRHHSVEQQLCRLLLTIQERVSRTQVPMTQEVLAHTLGVRREAVSMAAGRLQALDALRLRRGEIDVLDREVLERLTCECYDVLRRVDLGMLRSDQ